MTRRLSYLTLGATISSCISFILGTVSLFNGDWIHIWYEPVTSHIGICCTFSNDGAFAFLNVTLGLMYTNVSLLFVAVVVTTLVWITTQHETQQLAIRKPILSHAIISFLISLFTIIILIYFSVSFENNTLLSLLENKCKISSSYWLLIPTLIFNNISQGLISIFYVKIGKT